MIEKISLCLCDESGTTIEIVESNLKLQSHIDTLTADYFSQIIFRLQSIEDDEMRTAEKFHLCHTLKIYLKEMQNNEPF